MIHLLKVVKSVNEGPVNLFTRNCIKYANIQFNLLETPVTNYEDAQGTLERVSLVICLLLLLRLSPWNRILFMNDKDKLRLRIKKVKSVGLVVEVKLLSTPLPHPCPQILRLRVGMGNFY